MSVDLVPGGDPAVPEPADDALVGPLARGLTVLRAMAGPGNHRLRPSDLVHLTGLARSTVDRVVGTLLRLDYLRPVGRDVELSPRLMEVGNAYLAGCGVPQALGPLARRLADEVGESVSVVVPDGDGARFVVQVPRRGSTMPVFHVGDLLPVERCAPGALFATEWSRARFGAWRERLHSAPDHRGFPALPGGGRGQDGPVGARAGEFERRVAEAAANGWALDDQMVEHGLVALAVPVRDAAGRIVCALGVVSHTSRRSADELRERLLPRLRALVPELERELAAVLPSDDPAPAGPAPVTALPVWRSGPAELASGAKRELGASFLQSLARGLGVLLALGATPGGRTVAETAADVGLPRATVHRLLRTLAGLGYVRPVGRRHELTPRVLELGSTWLSRLDVVDVAGPHLGALSARVHESASMAVLDGGDIRYVARVPAYRIMCVDITVGTRFPAQATSMGRVLLAGLPAPARAAWLADAELSRITPYTVTDRAALERLLDRAAADGYALVDQELEVGLRSVAVPVRDRHGRPVAAVNVSTHTGRGTAEQAVAALLPALTETAERIGSELDTLARWGTPHRWDSGSGSG